jgi:hypothetical protein
MIAWYDRRPRKIFKESRDKNQETRIKKKTTAAREC